MSGQTPIRVLHVITRLIVGGAQENTMFTAERLDRSQFDVQVISGPQTGSEGSLIEEVRQRGVNLTILPELVRELNPIKDLVALFKLIRSIKKGGYSIVHTHSSKAGILGRIAARLAGVPIIVHTVHGWSFHDEMSLLKKSLYIFLERLAVRFTDEMIFVTTKDLDKGRQAGILGNAKFRIIHSAIPLSDYVYTQEGRDQVRIEHQIPGGCLVLGNVGRFSAQKNPLDWIRIAASVSSQLADCHFLLVGDGPLKDDVIALVNELGMADHFHFTGLQRGVSPYLSAMDVFLLTSLWEGLPRVIPEAMHVGLPVVAYNIDGVAEAIEHGKTGLLVPPGNLDLAVDCCVDLLTNPEMRIKLKNAGYEFARREFDLQRMIEQIEQTYHELLERKRMNNV